VGFKKNFQPNCSAQNPCHSGAGENFPTDVRGINSRGFLPKPGARRLEGKESDGGSCNTRPGKPPPACSLGRQRVFLAFPENRFSQTRQKRAVGILLIFFQAFRGLGGGGAVVQNKRERPPGPGKLGGFSKGKPGGRRRGESTQAVGGEMGVSAHQKRFESRERKGLLGGVSTEKSGNFFGGGKCLGSPPHRKTTLRGRPLGPIPVKKNFFSRGGTEGKEKRAPSLAGAISGKAVLPRPLNLYGGKAGLKKGKSTDPRGGRRGEGARIPQRGLWGRIPQGPHFQRSFSTKTLSCRPLGGPGFFGVFWGRSTFQGGNGQGVHQNPSFLFPQIFPRPQGGEPCWRTAPLGAPPKTWEHSSNQGPGPQPGLGPPPRKFYFSFFKGGGAFQRRFFSDFRHFFLLTFGKNPTGMANPGGNRGPGPGPPGLFPAPWGPPPANKKKNPPKKAPRWVFFKKKRGLSLETFSNGPRSGGKAGGKPLGAKLFPGNSNFLADAGN